MPASNASRLRLSIIGFAVSAAFVTGACGSSGPAGSSGSSGNSSPSPAARSPAPSSATTTGGFGDTAANPDHPNYICAEYFPDTYTYLSVAGPDAAKGKAYCSSLEVTGTKAMGSLPVGTYKTLTASNGCWLALGSDTVRVYTPVSGSLEAYTLALCTRLGVK